MQPVVINHGSNHQSLSDEGTSEHSPGVRPTQGVRPEAMAWWIQANSDVVQLGLTLSPLPPCWESYFLQVWDYLLWQNCCPFSMMGGTSPSDFTVIPSLRHFLYSRIFVSLSSRSMLNKNIQWERLSKLCIQSTFHISQHISYYTWFVTGPREFKGRTE